MSFKNFFSGKAQGIALFLFLAIQNINSMILIPMDNAQSDHLKAYGVIYKGLEKGLKAYWLLNYRGGSFAVENSKELELTAAKMGVSFEVLNNSDFASILLVIKENNMEKVVLEKSPKIAVYTPPGKLPWDDAVTLALTYAEIPYEAIYDDKMLTEGLEKYDWLHLHHEDFTGQYSKFYRAYRNAPWFQKQRALQEDLRTKLGFDNVPALKKAVAMKIRDYVSNGGFLFAMCSGVNTLEITLAALGTDIVETPFDGDGVDPDYKSKLDFSQTFAFESFDVQTSAIASYFGNIDYNLVNTPMKREVDDFILFPFSAKLDPVPAMLTQNHTNRVNGFYGLLTTFNRPVLKKSTVILGDTPETPSVRYIHGVKGKGQFAFLGGHDPEDKAHLVGDKHTMLELHKHSPGYRLILNNVLFPAAEKKEKKT